jgi:hypothetical protein
MSFPDADRTPVTELAAPEGKPFPYGLVQTVLFVATVVIVALTGHIDHLITVRALHEPAGGYTAAYLTHGKTVFARPVETLEHSLGLIAAVILVLVQVVLNLFRPRTGRAGV